MTVQWLIACLLFIATQVAAAPLFEADSKARGNDKMDIVVKEVERRERSSVLDVTITKVGSSVGASFFLLCSVRELAKLRGPYRHVAKIEDVPTRGQMLVGFLKTKDEPLATIDPALSASHPNFALVDLDQFAPICDRAKEATPK